jgi:hypothetical protein
MTAPASVPARNARVAPIQTGSWASATPTATEARTPMSSWPRTPMLKRPALNPSATASPPNTSGEVKTRVVTMAS